MNRLDFHADDYAGTLENSRRILSLAQAGRINSFSVITNMGCFGECMDLLRAGWDSLERKPLLSVHINLIDGYWLSRQEPGSLMQNSWPGIFLRGLIPGGGRKALRAAFSAEIETQIRAFLEQTEDLRDDQGSPLALRVDGHVHTQMIPLVFDALTDALDRMKLLNRVSFIRCTAEPLSMFFLTPGVVGTISPVNLAKNLILNILGHSVRRKLKKLKISTGRVFGVALTGEMDLKRVRLLLPKMQRYAGKKGVYLEVLSHPGRSLPSELTEEYGPDDRKAFVSPGRDTEYTMLMNI
ncbi:MAG: ChbG/HpnK family deacetylase [Clostridia bacterium]|nr:ChbG/HpnK family deacetylase [Clostridia bacterium]